MTTNAGSRVKLALLIDGDNVNAEAFPHIMARASSFGAVAIRRLYGQFSSGRMSSWAASIEQFDLASVDVRPAKAGKNAVDIRLTVEAVELLMRSNVDGIGIASNDSDYTPLAARIRASALLAFGFGAENAPTAYREAFDAYVPINQLEKPALAPIPTSQTCAIKPIPELAIYRAVADTDKDGRSALSAVGIQLRRSIAGFKPSDYGNGKLAKLLGNIRGLEVEREDNSRLFVRRRG